MIDQIAAFGVRGGVLGVIDTVPYVRDIARRSTSYPAYFMLVDASLAGVLGYRRAVLAASPVAE